MSDRDRRHQVVGWPPTVARGHADEVEVPSCDERAEKLDRGGRDAAGNDVPRLLDGDGDTPAIRHERAGPAARARLVL